MLDAIELHKIVVNEFASQYLPDELPPKWDEQFLEDRLPRMAAASAARLRQQVGQENLGALAHLLDEAAADPEHPLVNDLCGTNMVDWQDTAESWQVLQRLLKLLRQDMGDH